VTVPGSPAGAAAAPQPDRSGPGAGSWQRELSSAALVGWAQLPAAHLRHLVLTCPAARLPDLLHTPRLLADAPAAVLFHALFVRGDAPGRAWVQLLGAAGLPDPATTAQDRQQRLRLATTALTGRGEVPTSPVPAGTNPVVEATPLWPTTPTSSVVIFRGHTDFVWAVGSVRLPDGRNLITSAGDDETVRLWDPATGDQVGPPLTGHTDSVNAVATVRLPDGRNLITSAGDDETVRLWDPVTGDQVGPPLTGHTRSVNAVGVVRLPDGRDLVASASDDTTVRLWDPTTSEQVGRWSLPAPSRALIGLAGGRLVVAHDAQVAVLAWAGTAHDVAREEPSSSPAPG
jgi:hypothetical protein